jgi:DNA repair photolyase
MTGLQSKPRRKREVTSGTKEWADHNINCIKGCTNNCRYCYAKIMAIRFGRCTEATWKDITICQDVVKRNFRRYSGRVMFPSSHDIIDTVESKEACFIVVGKLLEAGNNLLITTKPKVSIIEDIIGRFNLFRSQMQFRFTITSNDDSLLSFWEPGAPAFMERFRSLKYAYNRGFKTSVSIEPFLDYNPRKLVEIVAPYVTESIWVGPMNYIGNKNILEEDKAQYEKIRKIYEFDHLKEIYENLKDVPRIRFKDSVAIKLNLTPTHACLR